MFEATSDQCAAAARRLSGHLVATPLIGVVVLPGHALPADLRVWPDMLQPGGSLRFRGVMHWLLRQLGGLKGVVLCGDEAAITAGAAAAHLQRVFAIAASPPLSPRGQRLLEALGVEHRQVDPADLSAAEGLRALPPADDADVGLGLATAGFELAGLLPSDCARVVLSGADLVAPVRAGLRAGGSGAAVEVAPDGIAAPAELAAAVRAGLRLELGSGSARALHVALRDATEPRCAILVD